MTKRGMRGFAAGLWLAAVIMAYFHFTGQKTETTETMPSAVTEEQVQDFLESQNKVAIDKENYTSLKASAKKAPEKDDQSADKSKETKKPEEKKEKPEVHSTTVKIEKGMTSQEVAEKLEEAKVIDDSMKLQNYLGDHSLEQKVQLGSFKLTSDMSIKEIAKQITS